MTHNDVLRLLRQALRLDDTDVVSLLALCSMEATADQVEAWTRSADDAQATLSLAQWVQRSSWQRSNTPM